VKKKKRRLQKYKIEKRWGFIVGGVGEGSEGKKEKLVGRRKKGPCIPGEKRTGDRVINYRAELLGECAANNGKEKVASRW